MHDSIPDTMSVALPTKPVQHPYLRCKKRLHFKMLLLQCEMPDFIDSMQVRWKT